ncbi:hypothetical protein ABIA03_003036 [Bradyrhizobium yuanmingense]
MQRILGPHQQRRRRAPAGALQGRQHLDDVGTARIQRSAHLLLAAVQRSQPRFGLVDLGFHGAHIGGGVDQLLIELGAVLAERGDLGLQLGLRFFRASLPRARGLQLLLALLDRIGRDRCGLRRRRNCLTLRLSLREAFFGEEACAGEAGDQQQVEERRSHRVGKGARCGAHHAR